jgi:hypothetical protein
LQSRLLAADKGLRARITTHNRHVDTCIGGREFDQLCVNAAIARAAAQPHGDATLTTVDYIGDLAGLFQGFEA